MLAGARAGDDVAWARVGGRQPRPAAWRHPRRTSIKLGGRLPRKRSSTPGDANSLATAAALRHIGLAARSKADSAALKSTVELAGKASELAPENPTIIWLRLQLCAASAGCDIRDAATTMRWVDAENGAAWIATLAAAQKEGDAVEVDRILADMAHGAYFDLYWNRTVVLLFDALKRAGGRLPARYLPSDVARLLEAMEIASAETIPSLTPLLERVPRAGRRANGANCASESRRSCSGATPSSRSWPVSASKGG